MQDLLLEEKIFKFHPQGLGICQRLLINLQTGKRVLSVWTLVSPGLPSLSCPFVHAKSGYVNMLAKPGISTHFPG